MKTATFIKAINSEFDEPAYRDQKLYFLFPPLCSNSSHMYSYVVVSAISSSLIDPETYIFPSDEDGNVLNYEELTGSYRGGICHETALYAAGYTLVKSEDSYEVVPEERWHSICKEEES